MGIRKKALGFTACIFATTLNYAASSSHQHNVYHRPVSSQTLVFYPVVTFTGGVRATEGVSPTQTLRSDGSIYTYQASSTWRGYGLVGAFAGTEFNAFSDGGMQIGLAYYQSLGLNSKGQVAQGVDRQSLNKYNYEYNIISRQALIESKIFANWHETIHPYLAAGLGIAFNSMSGFKVGTPQTLTFSPTYADSFKKSLTYNLGLGVDCDFFDYWRLGLGYRYTDLGKMDLGPGQIDGVPINNSLNQNHLYASEFIGQVSYIF